ncbi:flavin reductase family protein [Fulvitalea axinellae]
METIDFRTLSPQDKYKYLSSSVTPRPIALVSTVDGARNVNLSPFSFFNVFSANPPILVFSPLRSIRTNETKHTLDNVHEVREAVVNLVSHDMVEQTSLSSGSYERDVDEFAKSGFTAQASELVTPPRVKEAPVSFECEVKEVVALGNEGGSGNLVICEVKMMHVQKRILKDGLPDPFLLDTVARLGGDWYCRASGDSLFEVEKPIGKSGLGVDSMPESVRNSDVLSGNDLGKLGGIERFPSKLDQKDFLKEYVYAVEEIMNLAEAGKRLRKLHTWAKELIAERKIQEAWSILLWADTLGE